MLTILLLGCRGQVGWELSQSLLPVGQVIALDKKSADVCNHQAMQLIFERVQPHVVVNATAYTAVDKAEQETQLADAINHLAVAHLVKLCAQFDALLVHYSTDYVFDGTGETAWTERDECHPINHYGLTKRAGELALEASGAKFINLRTSWVYGVQGKNFIKTMLHLAQSKETLSIINDQIGAPTSARLIADVTAHIIRVCTASHSVTEQERYGHFHLVASGYCSWYEYACFVFTQARALGMTLSVQQVLPISTDEYPTAAKRPLNSRLNTQKLRTTFLLELPDWRIGVKQMLAGMV